MGRKWKMALGLALVFAARPTVAGELKRTKVAVMDFDYGTISTQWWGDADIGRGVADQIVDALVNDGTFGVIERRKIDTVLAEQDFARSDRAAPKAALLSTLGKVLGIKYIIAGSITRFGSEEKSYGAGAAKYALGPIGAFGFKKAKTEVDLTGRLIDTTTGEIVVSVTGAGVSKKGGGVTVAGFGGGGGAGGGVQAGDYKASAIGEAQEKACQAFVEALLSKASAMADAVRGAQS
jgi:curli biogenesis system outer membrane secretion channel CsgG